MVPHEAPIAPVMATEERKMDSTSTFRPATGAAKIFRRRNKARAP